MIIKSNKDILKYVDWRGSNTICTTEEAVIEALKIKDRQTKFIINDCSEYVKRMYKKPKKRVPPSVWEYAIDFHLALMEKLYKPSINAGILGKLLGDNKK